jgi:uncharacterized protein (DUF885 family)
MVDQIAARTAGQAERGIYMAKAQVPPSRALLASFRSSARAAISVERRRLELRPPASLTRQVERQIATLIEPAFDRAIQGLSDSYLDKASDTIGAAQYPGGENLYCELTKLHTSLDLTPEQVHARGLDRMAQIEESIREICAQPGFANDSPAVPLQSDATWHESTVEGVISRFEHYIDSAQPVLRRCFVRLPQASYGVEPLARELQESMSFGFYDAPCRGRDRGVYFFNSAHLTRQALFHVAALTYHELVPGHHLQLALQQENPNLHPFRAHGFVNAYIEGWAEYAATLAGEMGLYEKPEERYGRLMMDAFLTTRLVVDTGINALGWSLESALDYMRAHTVLTESEIRMESVRYGDRPGQVLPYKLGDTHLIALRERMRQRLGAHFDLKAFHAAVLDTGAIPLTDLGWHVDHVTDKIRAGALVGGRGGLLYE